MFVIIMLNLKMWWEIDVGVIEDRYVKKVIMLSGGVEGWILSKCIERKRIKLK